MNENILKLNVAKLESEVEESKMVCTHYHMNKDGQMVKSVEKTLKRGQKLQGFFGPSGDHVYVVVDPIKKIGLLVHKGELSYNEGLSSFQHYYDERIRHINDKFGIGIYYTDEFFSEDVITKAISDKIKYDKIVKQHEDDEAEAYKKGVELVKKDYPNLIPVESRYDHKGAAKNMRILLKQNFPGHKFSVKSSHYSSYRIGWTDGPSNEQIEKILLQFKTGCFDPYTDYHYSESSPFTDVYGGVDYLFFDREYSDEIKEKYPEHRDRYELELYIAPEPKKTKKKVSTKQVVTETLENVDSLEVELIDYSEKAIALIGDTKAIKDKLKELGGRFNYRLKCGPGWVFSKKKTEDLKKLLCLD